MQTYLPCSVWLVGSRHLSIEIAYLLKANPSSGQFPDSYGCSHQTVPETALRYSALIPTYVRFDIQVCQAIREMLQNVAFSQKRSMRFEWLLLVPCCQAYLLPFIE